MSKYVIDVSQYQGKMSWERAANAGVVLGIARATVGVAQVDLQFARNWQKLEDNDIDRGAYHVFRPELSGRAQADFCVDVVGETNFGAVDVETNHKGLKPDVVEGRLMEFLLHLQEHWPAVSPVIYTAAWFWNYNLPNKPWTYKLWVAHYTSGVTPLLPRGWTDWYLWQYSADGNRRGAEFGAQSGDIDISRANFRL